MSKKIDFIEFSRKGGNATKEKYGAEHYKKITTAGGNKIKEKYGREYYSALGKKSAAAKKKKREKKNPLEELTSFLSGKKTDLL